MADPFPWPCDRRDAHHPHTAYAQPEDRCYPYQCPGVGAHPTSMIGGAHPPDSPSNHAGGPTERDTMNKIATLLIATLAALTLTGSPAQAAGPAGFPDNPQLLVRTHPGIGIPVAVRVMNMRTVTQDRTPIIISSTTPAVCTVPANSFVGAFKQISPEIPVKITGHGTCTLRADQAASHWYLASWSERSYTV